MKTLGCIGKQHCSSNLLEQARTCSNSLEFAQILSKTSDQMSTPNTKNKIPQRAHVQLTFFCVSVPDVVLS
jgi:hypothetical protein